MELPRSISRDVPLKVDPIFGYEMHRNREVLGSFKVAFQIENTTNVPANIPFMAFPNLGHALQPELDWIEEILRSDTGRPMTRFMSPKTYALLPGHSVRPLAIGFPFHTSGGGTLTIARGVRQTLDALRDINLHYVIGAGNFPSRRAILTVPADRIRAEIRKHFSEVGTRLQDDASESRVTSNVFDIPRRPAISNSLSLARRERMESYEK